MTSSENIKPRKFISEKKIKTRISELAKLIQNDFQNKPFTLIYVSNGAWIFAADLAREVKIPIKVDSISATSYSGRFSTGRLKIKSAMKLNIIGEKILLVDDILDTGLTISGIRNILLKKDPADLKICVLLDKPSRRKIQISADYVGFTIPDKFVIGYGLDYNELYRNLPYIATI